MEIVFRIFASNLPAVGRFVICTMSKISIIIKREYVSRVKKKSFIIMTSLGPVLFAAIGIIPIWLSMQDQAKHFIEVIDDSKLVDGFIKDSKNVRYDYPPVSLEVAQRDFYKTDYTAILWVPVNILTSHKSILYFKSNPGIVVQEHIRSEIEDILYENQLESQGIDMTRRDFSCVARDGEGRLIGGATGNTIGCYTYIARLWVADSWRRRGIGRRLVEAAERIAADRNCRYVFLNTFGFQAGGFYERCGYHLLAALENPDDPRLSRQFMVKTLTR